MYSNPLIESRYLKTGGTYIPYYQKMLEMCINNLLIR